MPASKSKTKILTTKLTGKRKSSVNNSKVVEEELPVKKIKLEKDKAKKVQKHANEENDTPQPKGKSKTKAAVKESTKKPNDDKKASESKLIINVDPNFYDWKLFDVIQHNGKIYDATLNQSNVSHNNNKYYIIQAIQEKDNPKSCGTFFRWGRVGAVGSSNIERFFGDNAKEEAIKCFERKYKEKCMKGDYVKIEMQYEIEQTIQQEEKPKAEDKKKLKKKGVNNTPKLSESIKEFIKMIFDPELMNNNLKKLGYDNKKMPLGKLAPSSIQRGYEVLNDIDKVLRKKKINKEELNDLSSKFYTFIPHDFGFSNMANFILDTKEKVKEKVEMLQSLEDMKITTKINEEINKVNDDDLYAKYQKLNCDIQALSKKNPTYELLERYMKSSRDQDWSSQKKILDIYEIKRHGESEKYASNMKNKYLLWHGSRVANYVGIISQGLRIAPPEAPLTDAGWFGKGVYFADMSSVSTDYCHTYLTDNVGLLILGEVAMGKWQEFTEITPTASNLPKGINSTKAIGRKAPLEKTYETFENDIIIPMGPVQDVQRASSVYLSYLESYNQSYFFEIAISQ